MAGRIRADRRLYLTSDKARVVEEDDARAAFLLVAAGRDIDATEAERLGLLVDGGVVVIAEPLPVEPAEEAEGEDPAEADEEAGDTPELPEDFPGRDELMAAGLVTVEQVAATEDLTTVPGIGNATQGRIRDYLAGGGE